MNIELKKPLRIAVNTRLLLKNKLEGIGWFEYQLFKRIVENHPEHEFIFLFDRPYDSSFIFGPNVTPVIVPPPARHPILWYIWYELMIPKYLKKYNADIFVSLDSYTSIRAKIKKITGIHDLGFVHYDKQMNALTQKFMRYFTPKYIEASNLIVTVSETSKKDIQETYKTDKPIEVIYNAPSKDYRPLTKDEILNFKNQNTGGNDFFLFVGSIHPRKNVKNLLKAFENYKTNHPSSTKLVLIGRRAWMYQEVIEYLETMNHKNDVIEINHSYPETISKWMGSALAFITVSFHEGFGVPLVEAMACNTPIICSNTSSLPEVAGNAAILVSPNSIPEISNAMYEIQTNHKLRQSLIENGKEELKRFEWDQSADKLWNSIIKILND